ncbi:hypothetical protein Gogos_006220 [Gossypium gossypioides]|uniref:Uncharacterized protein n=1 Tax=Gossypium gossypioides TaxID=34282 RepID=A0A7J9C5C0_GOSGO|nr:hypothetical protein [Gossypium gossypioides]
MELFCLGLHGTLQNPDIMLRSVN